MSTSHLLHLEDIETNAGRVADLIKGRTVKHLAHDWAFQYALQFALHIIVESASRLPNDVQQRYSVVPWQKLAEIRARFAESNRVDLDTLWAMVTVELPPLRKAVREVLEA